jgi:phage terminase small subunit
MNKKRRRFCELFCDPLNKITYGNATKSAMLSGYSETSARSTASLILTKEDVKEYIAKLEQEYKNQWSMSREEAITECLKNYRESKDANNKHKWFTLWAKLSGNDIQRIESNQSITATGKIDPEQLNLSIQNAIRENLNKPIDLVSLPS